MRGTPVSVPLLVSPVIPGGFRHGFTTRAGGVSGPPFDSLNLGMKWGDAPAHVRENRRRLLAASGARALHFATQVHGASVARVRAGEDPAATARQEADAICTDVPGEGVGVYVADCVPLVLADARLGACAAVHAGWRGTAAGVATATVRALGAAFGSRPQDLRVALGPAIGPCCFEVGEEVAAAFPAGVVLRRAGEKPHVDLRRALRLELERAGVPADGIDAIAGCTSCDPEGRFFSYRRDRGQTGQHAGFVCRLD